MPMTRPPYPSGFREQMVELVRSGRSPEELAREFEPSAQSIRNWVGQADRDEGRRHDGLTSGEREELRRLSARTVSCARNARYWQKPRTGSRRQPARSRPGLRVRGSQPGHVSRRHDVPAAGGLHQRVLRVAGPGTVGPCPERWGTARSHPRYPSHLARNLWRTSHPCRARRSRLRCGPKRIARLMRRAGLRGISRREGTRTTVRDARARAAPDLVERDFTADAPDRLWVADIT